MDEVASGNNFALKYMNYHYTTGRLRGKNSRKQIMEDL